MRQVFVPACVQLGPRSFAAAAAVASPGPAPGPAPGPSGRCASASSPPSAARALAGDVVRASDDPAPARASTKRRFASSPPPSPVDAGAVAVAMRSKLSSNGVVIAPADGRATEAAGLATPGEGPESLGTLFPAGMQA